MGMPAQKIRWTAEMVRALPDDGKRYELVGGELLVSPAPSYQHQRALRLLYELVAPYVHDNVLGEVLWSPADIEFAPDTILQPDLFVVPEPLAGHVTQWRDIDTLLLVVEVLSQSTAFGDRNRKRPEYQKKRIPEYWIVDLDARIVECWRPDDSRPEILSEQLTWQPSHHIPALSIVLPKYFARVFAESADR
jgi:Uma2 family endonuclease